MYYGEEKARQMARSILPSKARVSARKDIQSIKKRDRRRLRQELHEMVLEHDEEVGDIEPDNDLRHYPYRKIKYAVRERRDADKLNHFITWAVEVTKEIPEPDGRLCKIKKVLPKGLIGIHALSHLEWRDEFETDLFRYGFRNRGDYKRKSHKDRHIERVALLEAICRSGAGFGLLMSEMIKAHNQTQWILGYKEVKHPEGEYRYLHTKFVPILKNVGPTKPRLLKGLRDIPEFLQDLYDAANAPRSSKEVYLARNTSRWTKGRASFYWETPTYQPNPDCHPEWFHTLTDFLYVWEEYKGDVDLLRKSFKKKTLRGIRDSLFRY